MRPPSTLPEPAQAAAAGDLARVRSMLAEGVDVNARDPAGRTPLFLAVGRGHVEIVRCLLAGGANPALEATGRVETLRLTADPLAIATRKGNLACVKLLLAAGADSTLKDSRGRTALDWARRGSDGRMRTQTCQHLEKAGSGRRG